MKISQVINGVAKIFASEKGVVKILQVVKKRCENFASEKGVVKILQVVKGGCEIFFCLAKISQVVAKFFSVRFLL